MMHKKGILISSLSRKVPLVRALRKAVDVWGEPLDVVGGDSNPNAIGQYFVDRFWAMPKLESCAIKELTDEMIQRGISHIIPTRDGELLYYSRHKEYFSDRGIHVMISNPPAVMRCLDKLDFFHFLTGCGFRAIPTSLTISGESIDQYVVKERYGSGSRSVGIDLTADEARKYADKLEAPIFQPYICGVEVSVDAYVTQTGRVMGAILRTRDAIIDGESHVTTTFTNRTIEEHSIEIIESLGLYGHVMLQLILDNEGTAWIMECNTRWGGASSLSFEMGLYSFLWFLMESNGEILTPEMFDRAPGEKKMIRCTEDYFL